MIPLSTARFIAVHCITDLISDGSRGIPGFPHPCLTMPGETIIDSDLHVPLFKELKTMRSMSLLFIEEGFPPSLSVW